MAFQIQSSSFSRASPANITASSSTVLETVGSPQPSLATLCGSQSDLPIMRRSTSRYIGNQGELGRV